MEELTVEQALEILKKYNITSSIQVLRKWLREGVIVGTKSTDQRSWQISEECLDRFIASRVKGRVNKHVRENKFLKVKEILDLESLIKIPMFQRDFIWNATKKSKFILTLLEFGNSLSNVTLAEDASGYLLVDGRQRISTIIKFADNKFKLKDADRTEIENKRFKDLSDELQQEFLNAKLHVVILKNYDYEELCDTFERLNTR